MNVNVYKKDTPFGVSIRAVTYIPCGMIIVMSIPLHFVPFKIILNWFPRTFPSIPNACGYFYDGNDDNYDRSNQCAYAYIS